MCGVISCLPQAPLPMVPLSNPVQVTADCLHPGQCPLGRQPELSVYRTLGPAQVFQRVTEVNGRGSWPLSAESGSFNSSTLSKWDSTQMGKSWDKCSPKPCLVRTTRPSGIPSELSRSREAARSHLSCSSPFSATLEKEPEVGA